MQKPTLQNVRVRSTRDALQIFYAVARNVLPMISRRLDAEERRAIVPGNVYIWEERCANAEITGLGMERWTDGISWSASRIAQEFLFYRQRDTDQDASHPSAQWANIMKRRDPRGNGNPRSEVDRLIKQTYSVHVSLPEDRARGLTRKWHLTAYFSQATLDSLDTIDALPGVGDVPVPSGWFKNARATKARGGGDGRDEDAAAAPCQDPWAAVEPMTTTFRAQLSLAEYAPPPPLPPLPPRAHPGRPPAHHAHPHQHHGGQHYGQQQQVDAAREYYRDPSPFTSQSSSSASSEFEPSPRTFSAPATPPAPPLPAHAAHIARPPSQQHHQHPPPPPPPHAVQQGAAGGERSLVPLAFLTTIRQPVRDPIAEDCLRRLSSTPRLEHRWAAALPP